MKIEKNKAVFINYTLKDDNGKLIDTSEGRKPLAYIQGIGNLIPGLEAELEGKTTKDVLNVSIPPDQAYGIRNEGLVQRLDAQQFSNMPDLKPGMQFHANSQQRPLLITVIEISPQGVLVDGNHPLAGKTLHFHVEVVNVRDATLSELEHGHVHGDEGHSH